VGEAEAWLRELRREGLLVPELDDEPEVERGRAEAAWAAFAALHPSRPTHFGGAGAIPTSELEAHFRLIGLDDPEEREVLARLVRRIDRAYLTHQRSKVEGHG
jgi:hypothetical protein